jgi:hypothetical protein
VVVATSFAAVGAVVGRTAAPSHIFTLVVQTRPQHLFVWHIIILLSRYLQINPQYLAPRLLPPVCGQLPAETSPSKHMVVYCKPVKIWLPAVGSCYKSLCLLKTGDAAWCQRCLMWFSSDGTVQIGACFGIAVAEGPWCCAKAIF